MRVLTSAETRFVAGGEAPTELDEVVVVGKRPVRDPWATQDQIAGLDIDGGGYGGEGGGGGGGGGQQAGPLILLQWLLDRLGSAVDESLEDRRARENEIANDFDPSEIERTWIDDGGRMIWVMKDGSEFWDENKNGRPDTHVQIVNGVGYIDRGNGWEVINYN